MKKILEVFIYEKEENKAFAMADFNKSINEKGYIFLIFDSENNKWVIENNLKSAKLKNIFVKIFKTVRLVQGMVNVVPKEGKINNFKNEIGFIGKGTGNKIVLNIDNDTLDIPSSRDIFYDISNYF